MKIQSLLELTLRGTALKLPGEKLNGETGEGGYVCLT